MYALQLTSLPLSVPGRAATPPCTFANVAAPRLVECVRVTRVHSTLRRSLSIKWKHAAIGPRAYGTSKPEIYRAQLAAILRNSSGRSLVPYASQRDTHGGADQVQYSQHCSIVGDFRH